MHAYRLILPIALVAVGLAAASAARAESFASSASSAGSASLGSLSDSVRGSSRSSSGDDKKVAEGDYRVIEVVDAADRPGHLQLRLQAVAQPGEAGALWLTLPRQTLAPRGMAVGDVVVARPRPYGVEFARADGAQAPVAFFLVLADDWHRELDPVKL
jgi:hypothetical protein